MKEIVDLKDCEKKFLNVSSEEWKTSVLSKPKLRTYRNYKTKMRTEDYLINITNRATRSLLAKFRCGILQLRIETGRFINEKLEDRVCQMCKNDNIEDEYHFLCICPLYDNFRKTLYDNVSNKYDEFHLLADKLKFDFLLTNCYKQVANYLKDAWNLRKNIMYV